MATTVESLEWMDTCIYARKSTHKFGQRESIDNQINICTSGAPSKMLRIVDIKKDTATGTDDLNRPEVKEMIDDAIAGKFKCIMMKGISRFFRDVEKGLGLIKLLDRHGVRIVTLEESFDSLTDRTANGKLDTSKITMYLMFAEMESKKTADRVKFTQMEKAKRGEWNNAGHVPYGYKFNHETKKLEIGDLEHVRIVRKIFEQYNEGLGMRVIMHYLNGDNPERIEYPAPGSNRWNQYTIGFILKNQVYCGDVVYNRTSAAEGYYKAPEVLGKTKDDIRIGKVQNDQKEWIIAKDAHEAIIDRDTFQMAQEMMNAKGVRKGIRSNVSLLSGIAKCSLCESSMSFKRGNIDPNTGWKNTRDNYYCMNYIKFGKRVCSSHHIAAKELEEAVLKDLQDLRSDSELLDRMFAENKSAAVDVTAKAGKDKKKAEKELAQLSAKIDKLLEKNLAGDISDQQFNLMNAKYKEELNAATIRLERIREQEKESVTLEEEEKQFRKKLEQLARIDSMNKDQLRLLLLALIAKVVYSPTGEVKIFYRFEKNIH